MVMGSESKSPRHQGDFSVWSSSDQGGGELEGPTGPQGPELNVGLGDGVY